MTDRDTCSTDPPQHEWVAAHLGSHIEICRICRVARGPMRPDRQGCPGLRVQSDSEAARDADDAARDGHMGEIMKGVDAFVETPEDLALFGLLADVAEVLRIALSELPTVPAKEIHHGIRVALRDLALPDAEATQRMIDEMKDRYGICKRTGCGESVTSPSPDNTGGVYCSEACWREDNRKFGVLSDAVKP